ncbi:MAG: hypothetical protein ACKO6N_21250 [Myxococcota bacterium]
MQKTELRDHSDLSVEVERLREALAHRDAYIRDLERLAQLGLLMSGVAHEINNLLTGAIGFTYLLGRQLPTQEGAEKRMLSAISSELTRCSALTRGLVGYARGARLSRQKLDLQALVSASAEALQPQFAKQQVSLNLTGAAEPWEVQGARVPLETMLRGILLALLERSAAASGMKQVLVRLHASESQLEIELRDASGPGEVPTVLDPLVQPAQGDAPFAWIVAKAVMKEHGGRLELGRDATGLICSLRFPR